MLIIIVILFLLLVATGPWYPYSRSWGYGPSGLLTILLVVLLLYFLLGRGRI